MGRIRATVGLVLAGVLSGTALAPVAEAAGDGVFAGDTVSGAPIPCAVDPDGLRICHGIESTAGDLRIRGFGGVPLEAWVVLPPAPSVPGADERLPLVVQIPGWGRPAAGADDPQYGGPTARSWARAGYAVLQLTPRGVGESCGPQTPALERATGGTCAHGYTHFDDARYEGRDIELAVGELADGGAVAPGAVAVTGADDGGTLALELATLRDRVMAPDGSLLRWRSPAGTPLAVAAAAPVDPWSDLVATLLPNGRTAPEPLTPLAAGLGPAGVERQDLVAALAGGARASVVTSRTDPDAAPAQWFAALDGGPPYERNPVFPHLIAEFERARSPLALLTGAYGTDREAPAAVLLATGWGTAGFGAAEPLRYLSAALALHPGAEVGLLAGDRGARDSALAARMTAFFADRLRGGTADAGPAVTATPATCPAGGPTSFALTGPTFGALHPGQVTTPVPGALSVSSGVADPVADGPCVVASTPTASARSELPGSGTAGSGSTGAAQRGPATVELPAATGPGYTIIGTPVVAGSATPSGRSAVIVARLWDVDPSGATRTLLTRGALRVTAAGPVSVPLEPTAWHVGPGHRLELELLGRDAPWARPDAARFAVTLRGTAFIVPVAEAPGTPGLGVGVVRYGSRVRSPGRDARRPAAHRRRRAHRYRVGHRTS